MAYRIFKAVLKPILSVLFRVRVEGAEHVPASGPVILASNHLSFCDSIFLPLVLKRRVTFVAKAEYFTDRKVSWFFSMTGQIPIDRSGGSASEGALIAARRVLNGGGVFGIYPEGTRSPDARLYKGRTGVARLALDTRAPIVPVAMIGTREAQPIGKTIPKFFSPITVKFAQPISVERYRDRIGDPLALRQLTDEVMFEVRELSGQTYVHEYAPKKQAKDDGLASKADEQPIDAVPAAIVAVPAAIDIDLGGPVLAGR